MKKQNVFNEDINPDFISDEEQYTFNELTDILI